MKYYFLLLFCILNSLVFSQNNKIIENILSKENLQNSTVGVSIKKIDGSSVISHNSNLSLTPASTLKLITTATAIDMMGDKFQYKTLLMQGEDDSNELIIQGYGDPTLGSEYNNKSDNSFLDVWLTQITKNYTKEKPLSILIDDSYFGYNGVSTKWLYEDLGNYYAAGAYGISVFDNTYKLSLNTNNSSGCADIVKINPKIAIDFDNQLQLNTNGQDKSIISGLPFSNKRKLTGNIPAKRANFTIKGDIPNPGITLGHVLANLLIENGYTIKEISTVKNKYEDLVCSQKEQFIIPKSTAFYENKSPFLSEIIKVINVNSNNHYTEHLIRTIGKKDNSSMYSDPLNDGIQLVKNYWLENNVDIQSLYMYDGCGLAPSDKISTDMMTNVLLYMYNKSKYSDSFINSLPIAGQNGTVRNFLKGTRLDGKIYVKSGSINNVQSFAGYYINGDKKYVFAVIVNNFNSPRKQVVKAIENILLHYIN